MIQSPEMSMIGPRLKLARSLEHINVLSEEIVDFMKDNPPTVNAGKSPDGAYLARVNFVPAPGRLGILAADVFPNTASIAGLFGLGTCLTQCHRWFPS